MAAESATIRDGHDTLRDSLIERVENQVDLPAYLVARGFYLAPAQLEPRQLSMIGPAGETVHLRKDPDRGAWSYMNARDPTERGSVVDFVIRRDGVTLDGAVDKLVGCIYRGSKSREALSYREALRHRTKAHQDAEAMHVVAMKAERESARSLERLGVDRGTFDEWRFGEAKTNDDVVRLLRNPVTLDHSRYRPTDRALVLVERPIDAVAYERAHGRQQACYVYTGDNPDPAKKHQIAQLLSGAPAGIKVVLAFGRGQRGHDLAEDIGRLAAAHKPQRHPPEIGGRWSDQMQIEQRHRHALSRRKPSLER